MPLDLAKKKNAWLITLENNGATTRVTDWTADLTVDGNVYTASPDMELKLPPNTGSLEDRAGFVDLLIYDGTAAWIPEAFNGNWAPTYLTVSQHVVPLTDDPDVSGEVATVHTWVYRALLAKATKNPGGRSSVAKLVFVTEKARMGVMMGVPGNRSCSWILFGRGCGLDVVSDTGTLASIDGSDSKKVTITGHSTPAAVPGATPGNTWHRGYLERDGIRVGIREWDAAAPTIFFLHRRVPAAWVGQTVTLVAGCDKSRDTCNGRFANLANFGGAGYATPNHNTVLEVGAQ
jgi:hypothetical protein